MRTPRAKRRPWATALDPSPVPGDDPLDAQCWSLLIRRHRDTGELAFYRCYSARSVPLRELVRGAGRRSTVEESFQTGKGLAGLDEHRVRRWISWRRWTLLAMIAHALLAVLAAHDHTNRPAPTDLIALTCAEVRRLLTVLVIEPTRALPAPSPDHDGGADTSTAPATATTSARTGRHGSQ